MKVLVYKLLSVFLLCSVSLQSHEARLAPEAESLALVHGCVSIINGEFVQLKTDLYVDGPSPIGLSRIYDSGADHAKSTLGYGFTWTIPRQLTYGEQLVALEEREGLSLYYQQLTSKGFQYKIHPNTFAVGYTSYSPGNLSGSHNLHNVTLQCEKTTVNHFRSEDGTRWWHTMTGGEWTATLGCGTKRIYTWKQLGGSPGRWILAKEIRPDGNKVLYQYDNMNNLNKVILTDSSESVWLQYYSLQYQGKQTTVTSSNGQQVQYTNANFRFKLKNLPGRDYERLSSVEGDHLVRTTYGYYKNSCDDSCTGKLEWISQPEDRLLTIEYDSIGRVSILKAAVGGDGKQYPFATFNYLNKAREWRGATGELTKYRLDDNNRISCIEKWSEGRLYSEMRYLWGAEGKTAGNLQTLALYDGSNVCFYSKQFTHDKRGNITREVLKGNLTGNSPNKEYAIERTFLPFFNVISEEKDEHGLKIEYRYQEDTNLLTAKLQGTPRFAREFYEYDRFANLIKHIVDNGSEDSADDLSNVTERTITEIEPITTQYSPAFGKPSKKREKYWESNREYTLRTTHFHYDDWGYPIQEDIYDAKDEYCYSIHRLYDAAGRILEETNPIGQKNIYSYDLNGNRILATLVDQKIHIEYHYDLCNRLIKETEIHPHATYETVHRYDHSSRKVATTDPFGNETLFSYDDLGRVTKVHYPLVNGVRGTEEFEYDVAGNKTVAQDLSGGITRTTYTARGQPIHIIHPDSSQEHYRYKCNGLLAEHTAQNGVTTKLYYDYASRPIKKSFYDSAGEHLYDTLATYRGSKILTETDAQGIQTEYTYDGAGRLIQTRKENQRTQYTYDRLGRQNKTIEWVDETTARITFREYDYLNRTIEERVEDDLGTLYSCQRYAYDSRGNCSLHVTDTSQGIAKTSIEYDSRHCPIRITDALGNVTITEYEENFKQGTTRTTITDPLGLQTVTIQNSVGQVTEQLRKDLVGQVCAHSEFFYDLAGRKIRQCDIAIAPGLSDRKIVTEWVYDCMARVTVLTEAAGAPEQKCTRYSYNEKGQKQQIILADGIQLEHRYDGLGRLQRYFASDNSIDYFYQYDLNGNVLEVTDLLTQTKTQRQYDKNNRITSETLANGLSTYYDYDGLGRLLKVILPDSTAVDYTYNANHLTSVVRPSKYEHRYTAYDLSGVLLEEESPVGKLSYQWDLNHRPRAIRSAHFTETIPEEGYDAVGNLLRKTREDSERATHCKYSYDALYQLRTETVTGFNKQEYVHDSLHNRRLHNNNEHTINHLNQLLSVTETTYTYDKRGNLIAEDHPLTNAQYCYDALGRLTSLTRDGSHYEYQYDAFNRRVKKNGPDVDERYLYIDQNEIGMVDAQGKIVQLRVLGQGKGAEIGAAIALELKDQVIIPIHDHCGHVTVLIDLATKKLAQGYVYTAFGEMQCYGPGVSNPWHFSSKRLDPESGWVYFGRRYYDPRTGRWTTPDPVGFADGPNLYAYVKNSPLTHIDLYGLYETISSPSLYDMNRTHRSSERSRSETRSRDRPSSTDSWVSRSLDRAWGWVTQPRVLGGLQAFGGLFEASIGGALALGTSWSGVGTACGCAIIAHGLDHYATGMHAVLTGQIRDTLTVQGLQTAGVPPNAAHFIDGTIGIVATMGGQALTRSIQSAGPFLELPTTAATLEGAQTVNVGKNIDRVSGSAKRISKIGDEVLFPNPLSNTCYNSKVIDDMRLNVITALPDFHAFPRIVDNYAKFGRIEPILGGDGIVRAKVILPGGYQRRDGWFEWIIEPDRTVNHRIFVQRKP